MTPDPFDDPDGFPELISEDGAITLRQFEIGPREIWCGQCSMIHRPEIECP